MRTKLGTALDIFILIIGPWIIYTRFLEIINNGPTVYPIISLLIVTAAVLLSIFNLYKLYNSKQQDRMKR